MEPTLHTLQRERGVVFAVDMPVRWVDTDALRVAHYSNYFRYVEAAE